MGHHRAAPTACLLLAGTSLVIALSTCWLVSSLVELVSLLLVVSLLLPVLVELRVTYAGCAIRTVAL